MWQGIPIFYRIIYLKETVSNYLKSGVNRVVSSNIALLMCSTCRGMTGELMHKVLAKYKDSLQVVPVDCPAETDPFVIIKMLKTNWAGIIVACPRNACCCPKNRKVIRRREMIGDILPVFDLEKERYKVVNVSPFDFSSLDRIIEEMVGQIGLLGRAREYGQLTSAMDRELDMPQQIIN